MSDNITVRGFVATEIRSSTTPGGVATASFRLGSTERRFDRTANAWVDGNTNWFTVQGYRQLAGNIGCSIKKGQRVIVVGRLKMRSWEKDGRVYHVAEIDAQSVGHDLMWGSANFIRMAGAGGPATAAPTAGDDEPDSHDPDEGADGDGENSHTTFLDDATGEMEEVDEKTGELKKVAA
ncbi:single-strand DNA-binding protein [Arthrobacter sp. V4I6]|uniref:single-stranded DNA-binding protein n=1 Tax=unclassified Arthrobacter TaxID=235627 RepID=UPI002787CC13|nr:MULTISPECIES: single-stranded DNA-binding protein [unclassified Arthrobacter]MDQ0820618.1 single-strand DNA-binding protein [Arthrobacter sp. V1I7]MDQ0854875.1 single-strand DNA-binding protein [Arthrobacter sp. V4I6]